MDRVVTVGTCDTPGVGETRFFIGIGAWDKNKLYVFREMHQ